jgi:hypothetical protein
MMEPFFGSPSPLWGATASPGFGWTAASIPAVSRSPGAPASVPVASQVRLPVDPLAYGGVPLPSHIGMPGTFPAFMPVESTGPTASAVVAAVAMRRGQPAGPTTDAEIEDFLYDAFDLIPGTSDVEVRCEGGRVTFTGNVPNKRHKRDVGELAWAIPSIIDVQNNATITARRRSRASGRESDTQSPGPGRKHA